MLPLLTVGQCPVVSRNESAQAKISAMLRARLAKRLTGMMQMTFPIAFSRCSILRCDYSVHLALVHNGIPKSKQLMFSVGSRFALLSRFHLPIEGSPDATARGSK